MSMVFFKNDKIGLNVTEISEVYDASKGLSKNDQRLIMENVLGSFENETDGTGQILPVVSNRLNIVMKNGNRYIFNIDFTEFIATIRKAM